MLDLQAIEAQLAKGDPALKDVYLKLKARLTKGSLPEEPDFTAGEDLTPGAVSLGEDGKLYQTLTSAEEDTPASPLHRHEDVAQFSCSNCQKVCASLAGLKAHERKCKA